MNLPELRFRKRLTQSDVAKPTGIAQSKISLFERGYLELSEHEKRKIAEVLRVNVDEIKPWPGKETGSNIPGTEAERRDNSNG